MEEAQQAQAGDRELLSIQGKLLPILKRYNIQKAILFGSFARGEATRRSDLDLILIQQTDKRFFDRYDGILVELGYAAGNRDIDVLIYTPDELETISHRSLIATALRDGKVIYESGQESSRI
jgi:predicted nucleotidyltransferase